MKLQGPNKYILGSCKVKMILLQEELLKYVEVVKDVDFSRISTKSIREFMTIIN